MSILLLGGTSSATPTPTATTSSSTTSTKIAEVKTLTSVNAISYARSIPVMCEVTAMKPFTKLHGFIDNVNVDANIFPCVQLTITGESATTFQGYSDVSPSNSWTLLRDISTFGYPSVFGIFWPIYNFGVWQHTNTLPKGEIIRYYTSPTTFYAGIVIARQVQLNQVSRIKETVLHVALCRYYTTVGAYTDNFTSYAWSTFPVGATIKGDSSGATATVSAVYAPAVGTLSTNSLGNFYGFYNIPPGTIHTGSHQIIFSDSPTNDATSSTTCSGQFTSKGEIDTYTDTIVNRIDTFITVTQPVFTTYSDPIAETFMIPTEKTNGCFVTSIDLFFYAKSATESQPVTVQICDTLNGYPTQNVLFNAVAQVAADQIVASSTSPTATRFRFQGPVFLAPGKEYAIKISSGSVSYSVWVSRMGEANVLDPTKYVSTQPYLGSLFKSQNNSTWQPDQLEDLMFNLYYAKFNNTVSSLVTVHNQHNQAALAFLPANPFSVANTSTVCKVYYPEHGLDAGHYVTFSGASSSVFNNTFKVQSVVNSDYFVITLGSAQTFSGLTGGGAVFATKNIKYDSIVVDAGDFSMRNGTSILTTFAGSTTTAKDSVTTTIDLNDPYDLQNGVRYIHSDLNEGLILNGAKSLDVNFELSSTTNDLSPALNRNTLSVVTLSNNAKTPSTADNLIVDNHTIANALASVTFTATTNIIGIPTTQDINQYKIGAYITISGTTSNNITTQIINIDKTTSPYHVYVSSALVNESPASTTIVQAEGFIDEIAPSGGTAESKYQTIPITLAQPATGIQIMFSGNIPPAADIRLYYRSGVNTSTNKLSDKTWVSVPLTYKKSQGVEYIDQTYTLNALPSFNAAQFKIVLVTTDSTKIPKIKDFRAICLA